MKPFIMKGKENAQELKNTVRRLIQGLKGYIPTLAIITFGEDDASKVYVKNKMAAAEEVGIEATHYIFTKNEYSRSDFFGYFEYICNRFNGVIIQLPVPKWVDIDHLLELLPPEKDVDGLTTTNIGLLHQQKNCLEPCTPAGIIYLLDKYFYPQDLKGKNAVVIGRSLLVGRPIAAMLLDNDMTVTICHSKTPKEKLLQAFANADLVVSAAGQRDLITEDDALQYFKDHRHEFYGDFSNKQNRIIVDVSINRDENGKLCGDFSEEFKQKYSEYYTPVPGGVGPMTVAALMFNTYKATVNQQKKEKLNVIRNN